MYTPRIAVALIDAPRPPEQRPIVTRIENPCPTIPYPDRPARRVRESRRRAVLSELGFATYQAYLRSALWAEIRAKIIVRAHGQCEACQLVAATNVHHLDYLIDTMQGVRLDALQALCASCHRAWHNHKRRRHGRHGRHRSLRTYFDKWKHLGC